MENTHDSSNNIERNLREIYLDEAATTYKMFPHAEEEMKKAIDHLVGNPSSKHSLGVAARKAVEEARVKVANLIGARSENIIFTSSGSDGNMMIVRSAMQNMKQNGRKKVIISACEHDSVNNLVEMLCEEYGFNLCKLAPRNYGSISTLDLKKELTEDVGFVSIMGVNNEIGAKNNIHRVGVLCRERGIPFHTDCVQAFGMIDTNVENIMCDFMTIASHKIHGPKGVGAIYIRNPESFFPTTPGGSSQEFGLRAGTENVPAIVGFGFACDEVFQNMGHYVERLEYISNLFYEKMMEAAEKNGLSGRVKFNAPYWMNKIASVQFDGVDAQTLLMILDQNKVYASAGSACNSNESIPSRTLNAIGLTDEQALSTVRFSFSFATGEEDVIEAIGRIIECVKIVESFKESGDGAPENE